MPGLELPEDGHPSLDGIYLDSCDLDAQPGPTIDGGR